jgi:hypothetical protein
VRSNTALARAHARLDERPDRALSQEGRPPDLLEGLAGSLGNSSLARQPAKLPLATRRGVLGAVARERQEPHAARLVGRGLLHPTGVSEGDRTRR